MMLAPPFQYERGVACPSVQELKDAFTSAEENGPGVCEELVRRIVTRLKR